MGSFLKRLHNPEAVFRPFGYKMSGSRSKEAPELFGTNGHVSRKEKEETVCRRGHRRLPASAGPRSRRTPASATRRCGLYRSRGGSGWTSGVVFSQKGLSGIGRSHLFPVRPGFRCSVSLAQNSLNRHFAIKRFPNKHDQNPGQY